MSSKLLATFTFLTLLAFFSCKNDPPHAKADPATAKGGATATTTLPVEDIPSKEGAKTMHITESSIQWRCSKFTGNEHTGTIGVKDGSFLVKDGFVLDGTITLDMNAIQNTDIEDEGKRNKLIGHLKSKDFFNVQEYPTATYKITSTLPSVNVPGINRVILGELTLNGQTHDLTIPMSLSVTDDSVVAESANFPINRTKWGLDYASSVLGTVKDKMIVDEITMHFKLTAK